MDRALTTALAREQRAFLGRQRPAWAPHLDAVRSFLGQGLREARGPALVLGAGSGLEVPWFLAPPGTVGWDADPWSRVLTLLRHRRWAPWVFQDLTGGLDELWATALRTARQPWSGRVRATRAASRRLAGLVASLDPSAAPLRAWIAERRPGTILAANVMGQFGVQAQRTVERAFRGFSPWTDEEEDPLDAALRGWTARAVAAFLGVLGASGADLWLVHDRGVLFGDATLSLGPPAEPWTAQLISEVPLEAEDPLGGVDVLRALPGRSAERHQRWLWTVAPGQVHVMEALRFRATGPDPES
ncbi:hypothetical protein [Mesoterricola silvestris]|uniref:Uncharacterized protein n=1 Tax=Mesoterricola silvestris TaxID=2927979 RepID=A0AA48KDZ5_9BACT|nr:hypothetical protein [Mesoterricola silvestris]BDU74948.1 hypothetical protein METEAL_41220 [Mesoterricola silvestris]